MLMLLYKLLVLAVLFGGGYVLLRWGMNVDARVSLIVACVAMPLATLLLWLAGYRGKKFK